MRIFFNNTFFAAITLIVLSLTSAERNGKWVWGDNSRQNNLQDNFDSLDR